MQQPVVSQVGIPNFVRIKHGALRRLGIYARRHHHQRVVLLMSEGLPNSMVNSVLEALKSEEVRIVAQEEIREASLEAATSLLSRLPGDGDAILGLGGGRAVDIAKFVSGLAGRPFYAVPTSLSNDGFCSPQSSLLLGGRRKSLSAAMPFGVVIDTAVCLGAPEILWWAGVGDLVAKLTAICDWKLAYHARGEWVDDLAALLSNASVYQFIARPERDEEGVRLLGTALMLNGISMAICQSSRPASGAEHLISHALDHLLERPRYHGLQVGLASYVVSRLQGENTKLIANLFDRTGFWNGIRQDPLPKAAWLEAIARGPAVKPDRYTILSQRDCVEEVANMIETDVNLRSCFAD